MRIKASIIQKAYPARAKESLVVRKTREYITEDEHDGYSVGVVESTSEQHFTASGTNVEIVYDCNDGYLENYAGVKLSAHLDDNRIKLFISKHVLDMLFTICEITTSNEQPR